MTTDELSDFADLRDVFDRVMRDVDAPTHRLQDLARTEGRRLRRRRNALVVLGGLAAAAAVGAFLSPVAGGGGTTASDDGFADGSRPTDSPTVAAADLPAPFVDRPGYWDMPAAEMATRLRALLPSRVELTSFEETIPDHAPEESGAAIGLLRGHLDGPHGLGSVEIMLTQLPDQAVLDEAAAAGAGWGELTFDCSAEQWDPAAEVRACTTRTDDQGRVVERRSEVELDGVTMREVRLVADGGTVRVAVSNSVQRKWTAPTSAGRPPVTLDQLTHIATAHAWTDWSPPAS